MKGPSPFLWFDSKAEEAANFYTSLFKNSKIVNVSRYGDAGPGPKGQVMVVNFELNGQPMMALNGGPLFHFNESVSFVVTCDTQQEVDEYWSKLTASGGQESMCGWLRDKYGLSWQIVPAGLFELIQDPDPARAKRAMKAMLQMKKLDLAAMKRAADQG